MSQYKSSVPVKDIPEGELFKTMSDGEVWIVEKQLTFMDETVAESESGQRRAWLNTFSVIPL